MAHGDVTWLVLPKTRRQFVFEDQKQCFLLWTPIPFTCAGRTPHRSNPLVSHPTTNPVTTALRRLRKKGFLNLRLVWVTHYVPGHSRLQGEALPQNTEKDFKKQKSNQLGHQADLSKFTFLHQLQSPRLVIHKDNANSCPLLGYVLHTCFLNKPLPKLSRGPVTGAFSHPQCPNSQEPLFQNRLLFNGCLKIF